MEDADLFPAPAAEGPLISAGRLRRGSRRLFGDGRRMFRPREAEQTELEITRVLAGEGVTHMRYRVRPA